jgi:hypothetical protein
MAPFVWLSSLLLVCVAAIPWSVPEETALTTATANLSPAPTKAIYGGVDLGELFKRDEYTAQLCGWQATRAIFINNDTDCDLGKELTSKMCIADPDRLVLGSPTIVL